jgi:Flp pilus assembly protein TadG
VEFALILPVFVLIITAVIDFGFIFAQQVALNNSARDAARLGVVADASGAAKDCGYIIGKAREGSVTLGIGSTNTTVVGVTVTGPNTTSNPCGVSAGTATPTNSGTPCTGATSGNNTLTVALNYTSVALVPFPGLNSKALTAQGVFQCEYK